MSRYDIILGTSLDCEAMSLAVTADVSLDGAEANYAGVLYLYTYDNTYVASYAFIDSASVPVVNGDYSLHVFAVEQWASGAYPVNAKVYHESSYYTLVTRRISPGEPGVDPAWVAVGIGPSDFLAWLDVRDVRTPEPASYAYAEINVDCQTSFKNPLSVRPSVNASTYCATDSIAFRITAKRDIGGHMSDADCGFVIMLYYSGVLLEMLYTSSSAHGLASYTYAGLANGQYSYYSYAVPEWNIAETYAAGEIVYVLSADKYYVATTNAAIGISPDSHDSGWIELTQQMLFDSLLQIGNSYPGEAAFAIDYMLISCAASGVLPHSSSMDVSCETNTATLRFSGDYSGLNQNFVFPAFICDVTGTGYVFDAQTYVPQLSDVEPGALRRVTNSMFANGNTVMLVSVAVPEYQYGVYYSIDRVVYYDGRYWMLIGHQNGLIAPGSPSSPPEWSEMPNFDPLDPSWFSQWREYIAMLQSLQIDGLVGTTSFEIDCAAPRRAGEYDFSHSQVNSELASFALIRTNPAVSGNVMLTVDSSENIWLNSIDANEELSKDQYKRFPLDTNKSHAINLYKFFDSGNTPPDIIFDVYAEVNPLSVSSNYKDQFDFSKYYAGVRYLKLKQYPERFSYFAPLYLNKEIPEYFVIFKIKDPLNDNIDTLRGYSYDNDDYMYEIMRRAESVRTFDLSANSKVGKYLRSMIGDPKFPRGPIYANFDKDNMTYWNGVSVTSGTYNSKGEMLYDMYKSDDALRYFEEYMTGGFRRNNIVGVNCVNLEFLFDDESSADFDFNRYLGFYVNAIQLDSLDLDVLRYNITKSELGNSPVFFDAMDQYAETSRVVTNQNGVLLPCTPNDNSLDYHSFSLRKDFLYVSCLRDKNGNLHNVHPDNPYEFENSNPDAMIKNIRLASKSTDLAEFMGVDETFLQGRGDITAQPGISSAYIKVSGALHNYDEIRIYHIAGSRNDGGDSYDLITVYADDNFLPLPGEHYSYISDGGTPSYNTYYINGNTEHGSVAPIVKALREALDSIPNAQFEIYSVDEYIFLKAHAYGNCDHFYSMSFSSPISGDYSPIELNGASGMTMITRTYFSGGSDHAGRLILHGRYFGDFNVASTRDDLVVKTKAGWAGISGVSMYFDSITEDSMSNPIAASKAKLDFINNMVVTLDRDARPVLADGGFSIRRKAHMEYCALSFFNIKDFDCDFYSEKYNRYPKWEYNMHLVALPDQHILTVGTTYVVIGGRVSYAGTVYSDGGTFVGVDGYDSYATVSGAPNVYYSYDKLYDDKNGDMLSFDGFFSIRDAAAKDPVSQSMSKYDIYRQYVSGVLGSEYEFNKENFTKEYATKSKLVASSCKWGYAGGTDARDNEYRLNNHVFFGQDNFAPSQVYDRQSALHLTHEWYYIVARYPQISDTKLIRDNYCYFDEQLDLDSILRVRGEFERYFTYVPTVDVDGAPSELGDMQHRYSTIWYDSATGTCETFFRGAKMIFNESQFDAAGTVIRDVRNRPIPLRGSKKYDGYKFTVLLRSIPEDLNDREQPPIRFRFIAHDEFKFVLFLIDVAIGHDFNVNEYLNGRSLVYKYPDNYVPTVPPTQVSLDELYSYPDSDRIDGDYRVRFSDGISDITYSFLYGTKHKKYGASANMYSTIRIPTMFERISQSFSFVANRDFIVDKLSYANYGINLLSEMTEYGGSTVDNPYIMAARYFDAWGNDVDVFNNYPILVTQNSLYTGDLQYRYYPTTSAAQVSDTRLGAYKQAGGGRSYYEKLMKKISFANIKNMINDFGTYRDLNCAVIEYATYDSAGNVTDSLNYFASVLAPTEIVKESAIVAVPDPVVPDTLISEHTIGYVFKRGSLGAGYSIFRYGGHYEPIFRDVFKFYAKSGMMGDSNSEIYLANIAMATAHPDFGSVRNFNHLKIAANKILALQDDPKFYPVYEKIGETTIGHADFNMLMSSWDYGFHKKYTGKTSYVNVAGSLRVEEDNCVVAKTITLPQTSRLLDNSQLPTISFDAKVQYKPALVADVMSVDMSKYCLAYSKMSDGSYIGFINVRNAMMYKFKHSGISAPFEKFLVPISETADQYQYVGYTDIDDYVSAYVDANVYPLYDIFEVMFYGKKVTGNISMFDIQYSDDTDINNGTAFIIRDVEINKIDGQLLKFKYYKPVDSGITINPVLKIKLI